MLSKHEKYLADHPEAMMAHAIRRLFERHGIIITIADYKAMTALCRDGTSPPLGIGSKEGTYHLLRIRQREIWAVYRHDKQSIVSFYAGEPAKLQRKRRRAEQRQHEQALA